MQKRKIIFFLSLWSGLLFIFSNQSTARIIVKDNTIIFLFDSSQPAKDKQRVEKVVQLEEEIKYDKNTDPVKKNELGINPLAVHRLKGKKFAISTDKHFAVILEYSCTQPVHAAQHPWKCDAAAMVLDSQGYVLNRSDIKGNFLFIQVHHSLPYFILWDSTCCDGPIHAVLFNLSGEKVCEVIDFQDESWENHTEFTCIGKTLDEISSVNLTARLIQGQAAIYDRPDGKIIGTLSDHARVHILQEKNNWALVDDNTQQGWVYKKNLKDGFVSFVKKTDLPADPIERLVFRLKDNNSWVRSMAAEALVNRGDKKAISALFAALEDKNPGIRYAAIRALSKSKVKKPQWSAPVIASLKKENAPHVLVPGIDMLGELGDKKAAALLIHFLNHPEATVRWSAAHSLGQVKDPGAVKPLITSLRDKNETVVCTAIDALGKIKDASALEPLIALLKDQYPIIIRQHAASALKNITSRDFGNDYRQWEKWWKEQE